MHIPAFDAARRRARRALLAAALPGALAAIALPAVAEANTVSLVNGLLEYGQSSSDSTFVTTRVVGTDVRLRSGAGIQNIFGGCQRVDAFEVSCPSASVRLVNASLGDGDDFFQSRTALPTRVDGKGGNDRYTGATSGFRSRVDFFGGPGRDTATYNGSITPVEVRKDEVANDGRIGFDLDNIRADVEHLVGSQHGDLLVGSDSGVTEFFEGVGGNDTLSGLGGPDIFLSASVPDGADRMTGGSGFDVISYETRIRPINATLNFGGADDGAAGEGDEIIGGNERINGGNAGDTIRAPDGSTGSHVLFGGGGDDTIEGADGPDSINAGSGLDLVLAQGGNDTVFAGDGEVDTLRCGSGNDIAQLDSIDGHDSCENRNPGVGSLRLTPKTRSAKAGRPTHMRLSWRHPQSWRKLRAVELRLTNDGTEVGKVTIRPRANRITPDGAVELLRQHSRLTRRGQTVTARLSVRFDGSAAGQTLAADVEATDTNGRRQLQLAAATVRIVG
jgi:hypothetical protein